MFFARVARIARLALCLGAVAAVVSARPVAAEDFRIENRVYVGRSSQPEAQSVTIFHAGLVYDFLDDPAEVLVFDKPAGRFVLLDLRHKSVAEVTLKDVADFTARLKQRAMASKNPTIRSLADPRFDERGGAESGEVTLHSASMTYRARLLKVEPGVAEQYRDFTDWQSRLNPMLQPGARPPFARLALNEALARHQATAREVELTLSKQASSKGPEMIRSQHELVTQLSQADLDRVAQAREAMRTFQPLGFEQYRDRSRQ